MRLFTGIPFPQDKKLVVSEITRGRLPVPYINTSNLHITLNFLGEVEESKAAVAKEVIDRVVVDIKPFSISFEKLQKFRQQIHLTVNKNVDLGNLQRILSQGFKDAGFFLETREYYPHVKLASLHFDKVMNPERRLEFFPNNELSKLNFVVEKIVLFESKLLLHHAHHEAIYESKL
jgi:RNA 2',3'-cyclic 3'-phosphodiesterase